MVDTGTKNGKKWILIEKCEESPSPYERDESMANTKKFDVRILETIKNDQEL